LSHVRDVRSFNELLQADTPLDHSVTLTAITEQMLARTSSIQVFEKLRMELQQIPFDLSVDGPDVMLFLYHG